MNELHAQGLVPETADACRGRAREVLVRQVVAKLRLRVIRVNVGALIVAFQRRHELVVVDDPIAEFSLDLLDRVLVERGKFGRELEGLLEEDRVHQVSVRDVGLRREELRGNLGQHCDVADDCQALGFCLARAPLRDALQLRARVDDEEPGVLQCFFKRRVLVPLVRQFDFRVVCAFHASDLTIELVELVRTVVLLLAIDGQVVHGVVLLRRHLRPDHREVVFDLSLCHGARDGLEAIGDEQVVFVQRENRPATVTVLCDDSRRRCRKRAIIVQRIEDVDSEPVGQNDE